MVSAKSLRLALACLLAAVAPAALAAQEPAGAAGPSAAVAAPTDSAAPAPAPRAAMSLDGTDLRVAAQRPAESTTAAPAIALQERNVGMGQNVALMLVGAAGLVTGLLIGDDGGTLVAVGGAVIGLYGLYRYLR